MIDLIIKKPNSIRNDLLSGLTVALALIPEAIAFSFVAHVDPTIGLYAAFIVGLVTAIIGGRPGMISGATGAVAIIFAPLVIQQTQLNGHEAALNLLFLAVALMGIIQMVFGYLKWGKFVRLIPHPVMLGFVNGLAIIIFKSQLAQFYVGTGEDARLMDAEPLMIMMLLIGLTLAIIHFLPKFTKAIPATLAAIITVTGLSVGLKKLGYEIYTVIDFVQNIDPTKSTLAASIPQFNIPVISIEAIKIALPYACLAAAVGLIESLMTMTLIDELTETRGQGNRESVGQGVANVLNGLFGGMGGCAMIGQSMINIRAGGRGRLSGISAASFLALFIGLGAAIIEAIPLAALVGVMIMVSVATFEWSSLRIMKKIPRSDAWIIVIVSATTVIVDLAIAVILGVIISALVFAWEQGKKVTANTHINENGHKVYTLNGMVFFGSISSFKELFTPSSDTEDVVIDFKAARVYDHSGLEAINNISERYAQYGKKLHFLNLSKECRDLINKAENVVEVSVIEDMNWHIATDNLA